MKLADEWTDYELIDLADGEKLERWGDITVARPDPQVIWKKKSKPKSWNNIDAHYLRSSTGGGQWDYKSKLPDKWVISYKNLKFYVKTMGFKHMGLFPEQAVNWDWMIEKIQNAGRPIRVLNLFAYTGGATVACAYAGAEVCHVDAAKGMVSWAKDNITLSNLSDKKVRFIVDDVKKFIEREIRRDNKYDAIIMDPPSYGRGPSGELWKIEDELYDLIELCRQVLTEKPLFLLINSYTTGFSATVLGNMLNMTITERHKGSVDVGEIGIPVSNSNQILPCGIYGRWESK
ncbi:MAG TPA: SAM-dependent methyltransferase [Clostridiales bacterium]|nr:MAG: SAM-dependent methyltransferase [Clostridiales bacterium GWD2_32_59]HAN10634.1 SAM-dependent methyltransferase [Clostridiales bacterium]